MWESHDPKTTEPSNYKVSHDTCAAKILGFQLVSQISSITSMRVWLWCCERTRHLVKTPLNWWMILWRCEKITRHWETCDNLRFYVFVVSYLVAGFMQPMPKLYVWGKKRAFSITMVESRKCCTCSFSPPSKPLYELSFTHSINYFTPQPTPNRRPFGIHRYSKNIATPDSPIRHD